MKFTCATACRPAPPRTCWAPTTWGRDLLSRLIHGVRLSLTVGLAATALNVVAAVLIGGTTGFIGGRLDSLNMFGDAVRDLLAPRLGHSARRHTRMSAFEPTGRQLAA